MFGGAFERNRNRTELTLNVCAVLSMRGSGEDIISIGDLYPQLTEEQQSEAEYYLARYLEVIRGIFERNQNLTE